MDERVRMGSCGTNGSGSSGIDCTQYCDGYIPGTGKLNEIQCDLVAGAPIHQLTEFCEEAGIDKNIFPITLVQAVFDGRNGMRLDRILAMCNNIYLQWKGTFEDTVNSVQGIYRRKGLIVNYRDETGAVSTIQYNSTDVSDVAWTNPDNWRGWSFDTLKDDLLEMLAYILSHLDEFPEVKEYLENLLKTYVDDVFDNINNYGDLVTLIKNRIAELLPDLVTYVFEHIEEYPNFLNILQRLVKNYVDTALAAFKTALANVQHEGEVIRFNATSVNALPNKYYLNTNTIASITITLNGTATTTLTDINGTSYEKINHYVVDVKLSAVNITLPTGVAWANESEPEVVGHYQISIVNNVASFMYIPS